ncbi:TolC family protein [Sphingopyxis sp. H050]|jgi:outer membrane protein, heavy metal efflux system|uniref:TolC family protein n=1 Tax=Sphingopyxis sp. H050 TaxID=1759072 RepID=UPI0009EA3FF1|nr:TolC family protein [Sphingopyxis sp. H050]
MTIGSRRSVRFAVVGGLGVVLSGCATIDPQRDRIAVEQLLTDRGAPGLQWDENGAAASNETVSALLANPLDRETAIRIAMLKSPKLQLVYGNLGLARADVLDAVEIGNPRVGASSLALAGGPGSQFVIGIAQPLIDLLTLPAKARLARVDYQRARYETAAAILGVSLDVEAAWYRDIGAAQVAEMRAAVAEALGASADLAQRFYDAGNITELQLNREKAAASDARIAAAHAKVEARLARLELNTLLGLSGDETNWTGAATLPLPLEQEDDPQQLQQIASANSLELLAAREGVKVAAGAKGVASVFGLLGSTTIGYDREREIDGSVIRGPTIDVEVPIFNQQGARRARALGQLRLAKAKLAMLDLQTVNGVPLAAERVAVLSEVVKIYREALVPERETVARQSQLEQNFALIGQFEVLQARAQQYEAYQGLLEAVRDYWLARVDLARLVGSRLPSESTATQNTLSPSDYLKPPGAATTSGHQHHGGAASSAPTGHEGHAMPGEAAADTHEHQPGSPSTPPTESPPHHNPDAALPPTPPELEPSGHEHHGDPK